MSDGYFDSSYIIEARNGVGFMEHTFDAEDPAEAKLRARIWVSRRIDEGYAVVTNGKVTLRNIGTGSTVTVKE